MFEIYGRNNCAYCDAAKKWLSRNGYKYTFYNIEEDKEHLEAFKSFFPGAKTVPQIIFSSESLTEIIGGYSELIEWSKKLKA